MGIWSPPVIGVTPVVGAGPNSVLTTDGQNNLNTISTQSNGILVVSASGVPEFVTDLPTNTTIGGQSIGAAAAAAYVAGPQAVAEAPSGLVDGANDMFTLSQDPVDNKILLFINGVAQTDTDYVVISKTLMLNAPPSSGDIVRVFYISAVLPTVESETPSGTIDGSNKTFVLSATPAGQMMLFLNGMYQAANIDYAISNKTVTMTSAPKPNDTLIAFYFH